MKSSNILVTLTALSALTLVVGCASKGDNIQYTDPNAIDTTNIYFGSTDLQTTAQRMVDGLLTFPPIVQLTNTTRPVLFVDTLQNQTNEQINTSNITNMVMTQLIQSGKFQFVDPSAIKQVRQQLSYQSDSGLVDPNTAIKVGKQIGAQYMLYGSISSIEKSTSSTTSLYYLITMKLLNLQTGIIEWADQKQIRKVQH